MLLKKKSHPWSGGLKIFGRPNMLIQPIIFGGPTQQVELVLPSLVGHGSDMAKIQSSTFFQLFDGLKKNSKSQKSKFI